ncbi:MAG: hypothetical protein JXB49_34485 [Bacteroidales bacterium]|nr:hypothetical protein [Bacteroidales bacterium]
MTCLKNFGLFILLFAGSNSYGLSLFNTSYYSVSYFEGSSSDQTPFNFTNSIPGRIRIMGKVNLSFYVNQSVVFQYRYRLEVPQGGGVSINKSLLSWTDWINRDINEVIVPKLVKEGNYKMVIEYRTHTSNEIRRFEKPFEVYSITPVNLATTKQSKKEAIPQKEEATEKLVVAGNKTNEIQEAKYQSKNINQDLAATNLIIETEIPKVEKQVEEPKVAQDIIVKNNGEEIKSRVLEITPDLIKYIDYSRADNPAREINISEVYMIKYRNGTNEIFSRPAENEEFQQDRIAERAIQSDGDQNELTGRYSERFNKQERKQIRKQGNYFSVAVGAGNSYGGLGLSLQYLMPGNMRLGIHGGAGYFPLEGENYFFNGGIKLYFWDYIYSDLQFGRFGIYSKSYFDPYIGYITDYSIMYGPSLLIGYDWYFSDHFGLNVAGGASYDINVYKNITYALDLGFIVRF